MSYSDFIRKPVSKKNILVEIDFGVIQEHWVGYRPGVWRWKLKDVRENVTYNFGFGSFGYGDFGSSGSGATLGKNNVSQQIGSVICDELGDSTYVTKVNDLATCLATPNSFYYDYPTQTIYINFFNLMSHNAYKFVVLGRTHGYCSTIPRVYNNIYFEPKVLSVPNVSKSIDKTFFGLISFESGAVVLDNTDGEFDDLTKTDVFGQQIRVYFGGDDLDFSEYSEIYNSFVEDFDIGEDKVAINIRDKRKSLTAPIPQNLYNTEIYRWIDLNYNNKPIPLTYGYLRNIPAVCLNEEEPGFHPWYFKIADTEKRGIHGIGTIRVQGVSVTPTAVNADTGTFTLNPIHFKRGEIVSADVYGYLYSPHVKFLSHFSFDDRGVSDTIVRDVRNNCNMTLSRAEIIDENGYIGLCGLFERAQQDYGLIEHEYVKKAFPFGVHDWGVSCWIKINSLPAPGSISWIWCKPFTSNVSPFTQTYCRINSAGVIRFELTNTAGADFLRVDSSIPLSADGEWHYIYCDFKGHINLYIDNVLAGSDFSYSGSYEEYDTPLGVAGNPNNINPNEGFDGYIDEIYIHNWGLGPPERAVLYNAKSHEDILISNGLQIIEEILDDYAFIPYTSVFYNTAKWEAAKAVARRVGIYISDSKVIDVIEEICNTVYGYFGVQGDGRFFFKMYDQAAASVKKIDSREVMDVIIASLDADEYISSVNVDWSRDWVKKEWKRELNDEHEAELFSIFRIKNRKTFESLCQTQDNAIDLAATIVNRYKAIVPTFSIYTKTQNVDLELLDNVDIELNRVNKKMFGTVKCEVLGIVYDFEENIVNLVLRYIQDV